MPAPSYTPATPGSLLAAQSLAASNKTVAVLVDASTKIEAQVTARVTTGGAVTAATYTKHEGYAVYGSVALSGSITSGATAAIVPTTTGFAAGQKIILGDEAVTVSSIAGNTLTISATLRAHADGTAIYLIEQIPTYPGTNALGGTTSTTFAKTSYLSTGKWIFLLTNTDGSNAVTVELSLATIDSFG